MKHKIAILHSEMIVGGAEKVLLNMLEAMDYSQYDVTLFLPNNRGGFFTKIPSDVKIVFYPKADHILSFSQIVKNALRKGAFSDINRLLYYRFLQRIHKNDWYRKTIDFYKSLPKLTDDVYDAVFIYDDKSERDIYFVSHQLHYKKRVSWIHSSFQEDVRQDFIIPKEYKDIDHFFCVSDSVRQNLEKYFPYVKGKTEVFYNLLDVEEIREKAKEEPDIDIGNGAILSVGRLAGEKNHVVIPQTMAILKQKGFQGKWYIIGEGGMRIEIEKQIALWNVENEVILLGERKNPYPYIAKCEIFVQTSVMEGFCTTTLEAKILHKPVVTTDAPGMREQFLNGVNGMIVDKNEPEAIAKAIIMLYNDQKLQGKIQKTLILERLDNRVELEKLERILG